MSKSKSSARYKQRKKLIKQKKTQAGCQELIRSALDLQQSGELERAKSIYLQVLAGEPENVDAWHLLGMLMFAAGQTAEAIECVERAKSLAPAQPVVLANLGLVYRAAGDLPKASAALESAVQLEPGSSNNWNSLGTVFLEQRQWQAARKCFEQALSLEPGFSTATMNLANLAQQRGEYHSAAKVYRELLCERPDDPMLLTNLGEAMRGVGNSQEAVGILQQVLDRNPAMVEARLNLARALVTLKQLDQAEKHLVQLTEEFAQLAKPHHFLGQLKFEQKRFGEAIECLNRSLEIDPNDGHARTSLGFVFQEKGNLPEAERCFRNALAVDPTLSESHSALLFLMSNNPTIDQQTLFDEHKHWGQEHASRQFERRFKNSRQTNRRLRIGYVSPDFRQHAVASYFEPVLLAHDGQRMETVCYADLAAPDATTARLQNAADHWRMITGYSDEQVADMILADEVDILVDLAGHTSGNRLTLFGLRPAPVQVTCIGYPNTTGVPAMDYRLSCEVQNPSAEPTYHTEELIRMERGSFCFKRPQVSPPPSKLPAASNGYLTFGSLHRPMKITEEVRDLWADVLSSCDQSRLVVFNTRFNQDSSEELLSGLVRRGIEADRIDIPSEIPGDTYLNIYERVDIGLDVFPWAGATTTMEAVWMGVPTIALYGDRRSARSTAAVMSHIGHPELIAHDKVQYVQIATELAGDLARLAGLRASLRVEAEGTVLDSSRFTRELEAIYRSIWESWVDGCRQ